MTPVTSAPDRVPAASRIMPVEAVTPHADAHPAPRRLLPSVPDAASDPSPDTDAQARSHADYAKVHEEIAAIVSNLATPSARQDPGALSQAESAIAMLMPQPSIVLPLPPASDAMVAFVNQVRQSIVAQAARTRAAMSNVSAATVDAAMAG
ncbi:hypothetical protein LWE61_03595 [Sphingobium sufflavum]|uniref:hypothetical protein n=1 Tax=Sphingobium sufflavum TaxID=1129547 RepID=UPI001F25B21B|nr:hypothetical protein [Sphingobium sufflavum]MCE7795637.1 hypothetical protein [Sphingobium sufflavum]